MDVQELIDKINRDTSNAIKKLEQDLIDRYGYEEWLKHQDKA
jgi:hypothetical protein